MGAGPIPWTALNDYAIRHRITDEDEFDEFVLYIRSLDSAYLEHQRSDDG